VAYTYRPLLRKKGGLPISVRLRVVYGCALNPTFVTCTIYILKLNVLLKGHKLLLYPIVTIETHHK
jgi:hypothetical protein